MKHNKNRTTQRCPVLVIIQIFGVFVLIFYVTMTSIIMHLYSNSNNSSHGMDIHESILDTTITSSNGIGTTNQNLQIMQQTPAFHYNHHESITHEQQHRGNVQQALAKVGANSTTDQVQTFDTVSASEAEAAVATAIATSNFLPRILALVFPQFHKDSLNDYLWGENFTDWDNLRKSPLKNRLGYSIPRPTELGYYDYTDIEPRKKQGELAAEYGIDGFVYHHYWFYDEDHPGPNLHMPLMEMLKDGYPNVPFALHWCASKWMNTWSGQVGPHFVFKEAGVLQKQYFPENDKDGKITEHYNWLKQFFHHENYIKVDGKPLLMMYQKKPGSFPVLKRLKELAIQDGFPGMYYTVGLTKPHDDLMDIGDPSKWKPMPQKASVALSKYEFDKVVSYPNPAEWNEKRSLEIPDWCISGHWKQRPRDIAGIISSFDNTPRRSYEEANLWSSDPPDVVVERFRKSLDSAIYYESCCFPQEKEMRDNKKRTDDDRFVLINAMNEWAEGMALEPSDVYGRKFLEAIRDVKLDISKHKCRR